MFFKASSSGVPIASPRWLPNRDAVVGFTATHGEKAYTVP
jgi:hypothetical protein